MTAGSGKADDPWIVTTPPGKSEFEAWRDEDSDPPALVVQVGTTQLRYQLRCIDDLHAMLKERGEWVPLGNADEQKEAQDGTVEAWGRSTDNPVGGWYGMKKGLRGRFGNYARRSSRSWVWLRSSRAPGTTRCGLCSSLERRSGRDSWRGDADGRARVLADGNQMPMLGLGVWQVPDGPDCVRAVRWALKLGYGTSTQPRSTATRKASDARCVTAECPATRSGSRPSTSRDGSPAVANRGGG